ncbi:hypothetical protein [Euzebya rosea]|uniref:hypothetical protein n=1 Tax=Euzebya rosea TaxID=2052804 RepID=UPI000D3E3600|nr:hypothetical protein [Euzebya rosea]
MSPGSARRVVTTAATGLAVLLAGCAGNAPTDAASADLDLSAYPACVEQPAPPDLRDVPGLVLPSSATTFSLSEVGPLTQVEGVVDMTPLQARTFYESHPDLEVLRVEDERIETEVLATDGTHRMFVKVQIACAGGSNFTATVGAEAASEMIPTPAGGTGGP